MDFKKAYAVDDKAAKKGKWLVTSAGLKVKVTKFGNPAYRAEVVRLQRPHLSLLRSQADTSDLVDKITVRAMAKTILVDWDVEEDGKKVKYTPDLGVEMLTKYPDFREDVSELSLDRSNFKPEDVVKK